MLLRLYTFVTILKLNYFTLQFSRLQTSSIFYLGFLQDKHRILATCILCNFAWTNDSKKLIFSGILAQKLPKLQSLLLITFYLEGIRQN